jgi:hypothetical protein
MMRVLATYRAPFTGVPTLIPGKVEAENYDIGGEGLTSHDIDGVNQGGANYRPNDGVDIGEHATGKYHIGYIAAGEWLEYTIDVRQSATYTMTASVASGGSGGGQFNIKFKNGTTRTFTTVSTGSWTSYADVSNTFKLDTGVQVMRVNMVTAGFDLDYISFSNPTSVDPENSPAQFQLFDNYPNPFNPSTTITFTLPSRSYVMLKIFDLIGREVGTIVSGELGAGRYTRQWNAAGYSSGTYFYRLEAGNFVGVKKLVLMK